MFAQRGKVLSAVDGVHQAIKPGRYKIWFSPDGRMQLQLKSTVTDELIDFPGSPVASVLRQIEFFFSKAALYAEYNFIHKYNVLLKGPPGTGKTSILDMTATAFIKNGGVVLTLNGVHPASYSGLLEQFREAVPNTPVLLQLENIERLQCSELENFLEGEGSIDHSVLIATTNYYETLRPAFRRPGRFDLTKDVGQPSPVLRDSYLARKAPKLPAAARSQWVELTEGFSIAHLKLLIQHVILQGHDLATEVARLRELEKIPVTLAD